MFLLNSNFFSCVLFSGDDPVLASLGKQTNPVDISSHAQHLLHPSQPLCVGSASLPAARMDALCAPPLSTPGPFSPVAGLSSLDFPSLIDWIVLTCIKT